MDTTPKRADSLDATTTTLPTGSADAHHLATAHTPTRRAVASWILYDLANTIFSMGVISLNFSLWIRNEVGEARADRVYGVITAISMLVIFVVSPLLGAMTDRARRRMPFLIVSTLLCVGATVTLARGGFYLTAVLFIIANIAYQAGLQFYDAMLPEVSTPETRGRVGGWGVGIGYLGSYVAVGLGFLLGTQNYPLLFTSIGVAFLLFAIPCFLFVRERGNPNPRPINFQTVVESTRETIRTLRSGNEYPGLVRFLVGRLFYTDAINTVISVMALYTINVAMSTGQTREEGTREAYIIMTSAITFAVVGGFFWGWLADKLGPKRTLDRVLWIWMAIFALAASVGIFSLPLPVLYLVAALAGFALGGIWAADRPLMLRLTPPDRIGEFYGLYNMVGRFSAVTGPMLWAISTSIAVEYFHLAPHRGQGFSVLLLLTLMLVGYRILRPVKD